MAGKPTAAHEKVLAVFKKSGTSVDAAKLAKRYKLSPSTVYRIRQLYLKRLADAAQ